MKTGILFDLDGTLLDTLADLADSVNHVLVSLAIPSAQWRKSASSWATALPV